MSIPLLGPIIQAGLKIIDKVIPDPQAKIAAQIKLTELAQAGEFKELDADLQIALAQISVNKADAESGSLFRAGWRPAIGWICGVALASQYIIGPLVEWISALVVERVTWPIANNGELMTLLIGMLGLGAMRTAEKIKGKA